MSIRSIIQDGEGTKVSAGVDTQERSLKVTEVKNQLSVPITLGEEVDTNNQSGVLALAIDDQGNTSNLKVDDDKCLQVNLKHINSSNPIPVTLSTGNKVYHTDYAINGSTPAFIESTTVGSSGFNIGNQNLTIEVNGENPDTVISFPAKSATKGYAYSGVNPFPDKGWPNEEEKIKVSVDGGPYEEIVIGKIYSSWDQIAAALQLKIRDEVTNGSGVIVQWNSEDFPFRMVAYSGTTGNSSSISFIKGGDDLAKDMKMMDGEGYGYKEVLGLDSNYYSVEEAASVIQANIDSTTVEYNGTITLINETTGTGSSYQVSSGGANTALQFPTTLESGTAGSGLTNLCADGSLNKLYFSIPVPTGKVFTIEQLVLVMKGNGIQLKKFAAQDALTNGLSIEFKMINQVSRNIFTAKTNGELFLFAEEGEILVDAFADNDEGLKAVFNFPYGIRIQDSSLNYVRITVEDDLTDANNDYIYAFAKGWIES